LRTLNLLANCLQYDSMEMSESSLPLVFTKAHISKRENVSVCNWRAWSKNINFHPLRITFSSKRHVPRYAPRSVESHSIQSPQKVAQALSNLRILTKSGNELKQKKLVLPDMHLESPTRKSENDQTLGSVSRLKVKASNDFNASINSTQSF
jgi:hypothetical protein